MRRVLHGIWVVLKPVLEVLLAVVVLAVLILVPTLKGSTGAIKNNLNGVAVSAASAATNGPITGDQSLFGSETTCIQNWAKNPANNYLGYWPTIGAPEHTDNVRSGLTPCADFTGDFTGHNQVFQYKSQTTYPGGIGLVVFNGPAAGYLWAGGVVPGSGQYVSKFNPSTGQQIWRTYLTNVNVSGQWFALGSLAIIKDGTLVAAAGHTFWKLDPATGAILASQEQPIIGSPASDSNFDGMVVAPDQQGTLLMKSQTRSVGCPTQTNNAMSSCPSAGYGSAPNTTVVAVDPTTLKNLAAIELDQNVTARTVAAKHNGKIYLYGNGAKSLVRVIWNPVTHTLTQDKSWEPKVILKGQTGGASPVVMGNWVIADSNANPSTTTPQCLFAVSQDNPDDVHSICPWGKSFPVASGATMSETPAAPGIDPQTSLIFVDDYFLKGVYAIHLDQQTGGMKVAWSRPDWWSSDYFTMAGPKDQRVLVSQNINPKTTTADIATGFNYTESVLWADEATGKTIAESAYNPSTAVGSLINPGYGGRFYTMGNDGTLFIYQVQACKDATVNVTPPSITVCPPVTAPSPSASASSSASPTG